MRLQTAFLAAVPQRVRRDAGSCGCMEAENKSMRRENLECTSRALRFPPMENRLPLSRKMRQNDGCGYSGRPRARVGRHTRAFDTGLSVDVNKDQYAVTSDGQRFFLLKPLSEERLTPITVILNRTSLLKK